MFAEGEALLEHLLGLQVNAKQIERLSHTYGELWQQQQQQQADQLQPNKTDLHYAMVDGSMVLTRQSGWKEMKLARVFAADAHLPANQRRNFIRQSEYVAHLGEQEAFFEKLTPQTDPLTHLVWVADGARWIWNWVEQHYPDSEQILDYYHCKQHLYDFAAQAFKQEAPRRRWLAQQEEYLLEDQAPHVLASISAMTLKGKASQLQKSILSYYRNNLKRMRYQTFRQKGLMIGSGPMEAAHRHVIQHRLKRSGQRWTPQGVQQVANLRVAHKSGRWNTVLQLIKTA